MLVGFLNKRELELKNGERKKYTAGSILLPFLPRLDITISVNKSDNESAPAFNIMLNKPKNWNGGKSRIGALWLDMVNNPDSPRNGEKYMRGHIESPLFPNERLYIAIFAAQTQFEGEELTRDYDILWSPSPRKKDESENQAADTPSDYPVIDDEEIPF